MAPDKQLHVLGGVFSAFATGALLVTAKHWGVPAALALSGFLVGVVYEVQQKVRHEGVPSSQDALATTLGSCAVALLWWAMEN